MHMVIYIRTKNQIWKNLMEMILSLISFKTLTILLIMLQVIMTGLWLFHSRKSQNLLNALEKERSKLTLQNNMYSLILLDKSGYKESLRVSIRSMLALQDTIKTLLTHKDLHNDLFEELRICIYNYLRLRQLVINIYHITNHRSQPADIKKISIYITSQIKNTSFDDDNDIQHFATTNMGMPVWGHFIDELDNQAI